MTCKYARGKYNITPNDFDLTIDASEIPANIKLDDVVNLSNRLQSVMPLTKILHLNITQDSKAYSHSVIVHSSVQIIVDNNVVELELI